MNGNVIANPGFVRQFSTAINDEGEPVLASPVLSAWSSIMSVGQIIGMTTLPFLSDRFGRKVAMYWYWFILACSVLCESVAREWPVWLIGKLLAGVGVGCLQSTVPTYITEVAPVRIRGGLLMCYSFWFTLGNFFAPVALKVLADQDPYNYLTPVYTQWSQIGLMLLVYLVVPESPTWCVNAGKLDRARAALRTLHRGVEGYDEEQHVQLLVLAIDHERAVAAEQRREKWYAIFKGTDGLRTVIALWTLMSQQFIGLTLFSTFASYFFQQAGVEDPFQATSITSGINLAACVVSIVIADKVGRRRISCSGTTLAWFMTAAVGILGVAPQVKATNYLFIFFACLWSKYSSFSTPSEFSIFYPFRVSCLTCLFRYWYDGQWSDRMGLHWRDFVSASEGLHSRFWCSLDLRRRRCHERSGTLHGKHR